MPKFVIDTDPGIDDAHAIMMALAYPGIDVVALTTVAGNVSLERATANALVILDRVGRDVPVYAGCEDALVVPTARRAISHGVDGLGDSGFPPSSRRPSAEHAANALVRLADESPGELTLVALGPLSNIALATRLDPHLPEKYERLIVMGGAIHAKGNSWGPAAEFNFSIDPEADSIVLGRWPGLTVVSWEATMKHALSAAQFDELVAIDSPRAEFFRRMFSSRSVTQIQELGVWYDADALAMAVALEPGIVQSAEHLYVQIELAGQLTRGQTVVDWFGITGCPPNAHLVMDVDGDRLFELLKLGLV